MSKPSRKWLLAGFMGMSNLSHLLWDSISILLAVLLVQMILTVSFQYRNSSKELLKIATAPYPPPLPAFFCVTWLTWVDNSWFWTRYIILSSEVHLVLTGLARVAQCFICVVLLLAWWPCATDHSLLTQKQGKVDKLHSLVENDAQHLVFHSLCFH